MALDLFVGESRLFACDQELPAISLSPGLATAENSGKRHVAIHGARDARALYQAVRAFIDARPDGKGAIERLTCVLPTTDLYYDFQEVLFASFPE